MEYPGVNVVIFFPQKELSFIIPLDDEGSAVRPDTHCTTRGDTSQATLK